GGLTDIAQRSRRKVRIVEDRHEAGVPCSQLANELRQAFGGGGGRRPQSCRGSPPVGLSQGEPGERPLVALRPLREQRRLAVTRGGDDQGKRRFPSLGQAPRKRRPT